MKKVFIYDPIHWYSVNVYICSPVQFQRIAYKNNLDRDINKDMWFAYSFMEDNQARIWLYEYNHWILTHESFHVYRYFSEYYWYDSWYQSEFIPYHSQYMVDKVESVVKNKKIVDRKLRKPIYK